MNFSPRLGLTLAVLAALSAASAGTSAASLSAAPTTYSFQTSFGGTDYTGGGVAGVANFVPVAQTGTDAPRYTNIYGATEGGATFSYEAVSYVPHSNATVASDPMTLLTGWSQTNYGSTEHISLTGLAASTPFTAYFYGTPGGESGATNTDRTVFQLTDSTFGTNLGASQTTTSAQDTTFATPDNYVVLQGTTDATGAIYATYTNSTANRPAFMNGAQFTVGAVPEASSSISFGLLLGSIGLIVVSARKRAHNAASVK